MLLLKQKDAKYAVDGEVQFRRGYVGLVQLRRGEDVLPGSEDHVVRRADFELLSLIIPGDLNNVDERLCRRVIYINMYAPLGSIIVRSIWTVSR